MIIQLKEDAADTAGKVIYTARVHTVGERENGEARGSGGRLDVKLSLPGSPREGTNPEQLFAAGWSACFESSDRNCGPQARGHRASTHHRRRSGPASCRR